MECCSRSRSPNDSQADDEGKKYCGFCWQAWIDEIRGRCPGADGGANSAPEASLNDRLMLSPTGQQAEGCVKELYDDDDSIGSLEALLSDSSSGSFFLLSRKLGIVFDSERTEDGKLRRVGVPSSDARGGVKFDPHYVQAPKSFPFPANPADHCETPSIAYADIAPVLEWLASRLEKTKHSLRIYDPYYCAGSVKRHLEQLGFPKVYNECEDFYETVARRSTPQYDVLITNPPYVPTPARDHIQSLVQFAVAQRKPFLLLMPTYVYMKPFWEALSRAIVGGPRPFFLLPPKPREYVYESPLALRTVNSSQRKTAPFVTFWYCWLGRRLQGHFYRDYGFRNISLPRLTIACTEMTLPDSFKDSNDRSRRKKKETLGKRKRASAIGESPS